MTPNEYIESGILETYALGAATPGEQQEVERMAMAHPEVREALDRILADMESYATLHAIQPDDAVRDRIFQSITAQPTAAAPSGSNQNSMPDAGRMLPLSPPTSPARWKVFAAAASVLLLVSAAINLVLYSQLSNASGRISELESQNTTLAANYTNLQIETSEADSLRNEAIAMVQFLRNPATKTVPLNSVLDGHPMKAMVHWDTNTKMVAVDPMTLPATEEGKQYELWAIVKGKPVAAGVFSVTDSTGIHMMQAVPEADAFAVTLEREGGVASPEGPMYVLGNTAP
jgi:anti-sigma-K factor RskA